MRSLASPLPLSLLRPPHWGRAPPGAWEATTPFPSLFIKLYKSSHITSLSKGIVWS